VTYLVHNSQRYQIAILNTFKTVSLQISTYHGQWWGVHVDWCVHYVCMCVGR